jgi:hypothetical protein
MAEYLEEGDLIFRGEEIFTGAMDGGSVCLIFAEDRAICPIWLVGEDGVTARLARGRRDLSAEQVMKQFDSTRDSDTGNQWHLLSLGLFEHSVPLWSLSKVKRGNCPKSMSLSNRGVSWS